MNIPSFERYIKNNPKWNSKMNFRIDGGVSEAPVVEIKENKPFETGTTINEGDNIKILSKTYKTLGKEQYALIKTTSGNIIQGYLHIGYIRTPLSSEIMQTKEISIRNLGAALRDAIAPIDIIVQNTMGGGQSKLNNIIGVINVDGLFAADYAFYDKRGTPVLWVVHDEGIKTIIRKPISSNIVISRHAETQNFLNDIVEYLEGDYEYSNEIEKSVNLLNIIFDAKREEEKEEHDGASGEFIDLHAMDYDKNYGKSFRWALTPEDQVGTFSLVTPSNGDAWKNWKPVSAKQASMLKDKWHQHKETGTLYDFVAPHKAKQIYKKTTNFQEELIIRLSAEGFRQIANYMKNMSGKEYNNFLNNIKTNKRTVEEMLSKERFNYTSRQIQNMNGLQYNNFLSTLEFDPGPIKSHSSILSNSFWRKIADPQLKRMSLYGEDVMFSPNRPGPNNAQIAGKGNIIFNPIDSMESTYELSFSSHISTNEDHENIHMDTEPVFLAEPQHGAPFKSADKYYHGAQISIVPHMLITRSIAGATEI